MHPAPPEAPELILCYGPCKDRLPREAFHRDSRSARGVQRYCKECKRAHDAQRWPIYGQSNEWRAKHNAAVERYRERHPERAAAWKAVAKAIREGVLSPPRCELRGTRGHRCAGQVEYHHEDYRHPLTVRGLCKAAHVVADQIRRHRHAAEATRAAA